MRISQVFDTWIRNDELGLAARALVVPLESISEDALPDDLPGLTGALGLEVVTPLGPSSLVPALAVCLAAAAGDLDAPGDGDELQSAVADVPRPAYVFAEYLAFARCLPSREHGRLGEESLAAVVTTAAARGAGAFAGYTLADGEPLLFVTAPVGLVICGADGALERALAGGLRDAVGALLGSADGDTDIDTV